MNTEQFKYFSLVYETLNFSAAARRIPMSLPGIIKAIKQFERYYGVPFFMQNESGTLVPTKYADEFYRFANRWETELLLLEHAFEQIKAQENHEIRIGFCHGIIGLLGPDFVPRFEKDHPGISLIYHEYGDYECDKALRQQACDFAFTLEPYEHEFITTPLLHSSIEFWVNRNNPLFEAESLTIKDLNKQFIAIPGRGYKCFAKLLSLCKEQDVELEKIFEIEEIYRIFEFALNGRGLGFTSKELRDLSVFQREGEIVCLPIEGWTWNFGISHLPSHTLTKAEQQFYDYCVKTTA
ncbi:MAG: LysR family transcriptional regulator [Coriobacteriales bacterium]|nr:LysR family transcriptional regulator [Coriobacteriales bacterium]